MPIEPCTIEVLRKIVRYDELTGFLYWLERPTELFRTKQGNPEKHCLKWNIQHAGKRAMSTSKGDGYLLGAIFNKKVRAHRVAWALHYGYWPKGFIDHVNGNRSDNRICNLRDITQKINNQNMCIRKDNKSGWTGVSFRGGPNPWRAEVRVNNKSISLGRFSNKDDAIAARMLANKKYGFHPNHGRITF